MKKTLIIMLTALMTIVSIPMAQAADWDKAGKVLTAIEGLRIFSGGRLDVIGEIGERATGHKYTNKKRHEPHYEHGHHPHKKYHRKKVVRRYSCTKEKIWVPEHQWIRKLVPEQEQFDDELGRIIVEQHYIKVYQEVGGHWEFEETCDDFRS